MTPLGWIGSSHADLLQFPNAVIRDIGFALYVAQCGDKHPHAKPLKGFGGAGVLEVVERFEGDTYRAVYTVRYIGIVYVLHAFQKTSRRGVETPRRHLEIIRTRLQQAERAYERWRPQTT